MYKNIQNGNKNHVGVNEDLSTLRSNNSTIRRFCVKFEPTRRDACKYCSDLEFNSFNIVALLGLMPLNAPH